MQFIIPKLFTSKRNSKAGSNDDTGSDGDEVSNSIGISFSVYVSVHIQIYICSLDFFSGNCLADAENNISERRITFTESPVIARKNFSGIFIYLYIYLF